jgi:predicted hexulose-6-phosphate isomerase
MKNYSLGLYEKAMPPGLSFSEMLQMTSRCGFDRLEISVDESDARLARLEWSQDKIKALGQLSHDLGVPIKTMCLSGHRRFPFGSHDAKIREHSIEIMKKAVDFSATMGIAIIQLAGYDVYYEEGDDATRKFFEENLRFATEYASKHGVILAFETMETPFMDTVEKAMNYVYRIHSPYLGVYPDIGNLKNASVLYGSDLCEDIKSGAGHIFAAHLKETVPGVYRDMTFGAGHTQYKACIEVLWRMGVRMYTGEFWYDGKSDAERVISEASAFLRNKIETVAQSIQSPTT